jgi:putative heme-binding domain-containing protein
VRRECAIALAREELDPEALRQHRRAIGGQQWAFLARHYDGKDRWQLEALGIGAAGNWDACLDAYATKEVTAWGIDKQSFRDIIWRSRGKRTPDLLASIISDKTTPADELPRMMRAFDFQKDSDAKQAALVKLAFGQQPDAARQSFVTAEAIARLKGLDFKSQPQHLAALNKLLDQTKGTTTFVELVGKFGVSERYLELLTLAQKYPAEQIGVDAMRMLLDKDQVKLIGKGLAADKEEAVATAQALASAANEKANVLLLPIVSDAQKDLELRRQATRALAKNKNGAVQVIKLAQAMKLDAGLKEAAGSALSIAPWKDVVLQAVKLFPAPAGKDNKPLPTIPELVKLKGSASNGQLVFAKTGTCAKCHIVNGEGKDVGPNLSEIGKKLSREAIFEAILYPSASISHNYETYIVETKAGNQASGLLVSKTPTEITLKDAESLLRTYKIAEVESITRSPVSIMPADLHKALSTQDLADLVEYLQTLREVRKK